MMENYNFPAVNRTATIKDMLQQEFGKSIGFHNRSNKNESTIVYDVSKGGSFIESAINFWGISIDSMLKHIAKYMRENFRNKEIMTWPPSTADLDTDSSIPEEMLKFLIWLDEPSATTFEFHDPRVVSIGDILLSYITNKRTKFQVSHF